MTDFVQDTGEVTPGTTTPIQPMSLAPLFFIAGTICFAVGFFTMYYYDSGYSGIGKIVGADAYNYIIIGLRGLGWMLAGLAFVVIGAEWHLHMTIVRRWPVPGSSPTAATPAH